MAWDRQKGYGYVTSSGRRVFLHAGDFAERHKAPEVGDVIQFALGKDQQGRTCATQAVHRNDGGRIRLADLCVQLLLLVAPLIAGHRVAPGEAMWIFGGWIGLASALTYFLYAHDKRRARLGGWRIAESSLHAFELLGGWPGAFLAQRRLRHKCAKPGYQMVFWLIVATHQFAAIDYLLDWRWTRAAADSLQRVVRIQETRTTAPTVGHMSSR